MINSDAPGRNRGAFGAWRMHWYSVFLFLSLWEGLGEGLQRSINIPLSRGLDGRAPFLIAGTRHTQYGLTDIGAIILLPT